MVIDQRRQGTAVALESRSAFTSASRGLGERDVRARLGPHRWAAAYGTDIQRERPEPWTHRPKHGRGFILQAFGGCGIAFRKVDRRHPGQRIPDPPARLPEGHRPRRVSAFGSVFGRGRAARPTGSRKATIQLRVPAVVPCGIML